MDKKIYTVTLVVYFSGFPQKIFNVKTSNTPVDTFLKNVLNTFTKDELTSLIKISCCQINCSSNDDLLDFLKDSSWGNFNFNTDVHSDTDTRKHNRLRNEVLSKKFKD